MNWFTCNYMNLVVNVVTVCLNFSAGHRTDLSHEPCCKSNHTHLKLIHECSICYLTLYAMIATSDWTSPLEVVYVLLCCVFLFELGLIHFSLKLTFTFFSLRSVITSHTPSLTSCISHTLATDRVILLAYVRHHGQGIMLWPTSRIPTPNCLTSNWDFLLGRSP